MKYNGISSGNIQAIKLPPFAGGINYRDGELIADNQLSDALNVWFKDGTCKTRPGFISNESFKKSINISTGIEAGKVRAYPDIVKGFKTLISFTTLNFDNNNKWTQKDYFCWFGNEGCSDFSVSAPASFISEGESMNFFVFENNNYIFTVYADGTVNKKSFDGIWTDAFVSVTDADIYVPTVFYHCKALSNKEFSGTQIEGHNLIGNYYKMVYSTVNRERLTGGTTQIEMYYPLPKCDDVSIVTGYKFSAEIIDKNGNTTRHEVTLANGYGVEDVAGADGMVMEVNLGDHIWFYSGNRQGVYLTENDYVEDNMTLTIPLPQNKRQRDVVFKMTQSAWFGGAAAGKKGGTRLFLCGNTESDFKARLIWSGLNEPLYFTENCGSYVGKRSQAITALGRQDERLVIFKEDEIYYTYYAENSDITGEDLTNQDVIDYDANAVFFPLVSITGDVGCDAPGTVAYCRGKLVWASSERRHVYTLASPNAYNTNMRVLEISDMIEDDFKQYGKDAFRAAIGTDFDGYYILVIGNSAYVCDYNTTGFRYINSYTKKEDANTKIPWFLWELPRAGIFFAVESGIAAGALLCKPGDSTGKITFSFLKKDSEADEDGFYEYGSAGAQIVSKNIKSIIETKHYDFDSPQRYKRISQIDISFLHNAGRDILFEVVCERGTLYAKTFVNVMSEEGHRNIRSIKNRVFRPGGAGANKLCFRISSYGKIGLSEITVVYQLLGGVK